MSKIFDCQQKIVDLLNADPFFSGAAIPPDAATKPVGVLSQRVGDIPNAVAKALQSLGAGVMVMIPLVTFPENYTPDLTVEMKFAVVVTENVIINQSDSGTKKPAESIVEKVLQVLHYEPNGVDVGETEPGRFMIDTNAVRQMPPPAGQTALLLYTIAVTTSINLN